MRRMMSEMYGRVLVASLLLLGLLLAAGPTASLTAQAPVPGRLTLFEGARLIVGDGRPPIENSAFLVDGTRFHRIGIAGQVPVPEGTTRVDLRGKTVMPAIIDTHVHMPTNREMLIDALQRKAYYGAGVVTSLGQDTGDVAFQVRNEVIPNAARLRTAGRGITMPEPGRTEAPYWVTSPAEARKAVTELAGRRVDLVKIWVDDRDGTHKKLSPDIYAAVIDEAHTRGFRVTAHLFTLEDAKGLVKAGIDMFAHGVRDKDVDEEFMAMVRQRPALFLVPNLPDRGVATNLSWLSESVPADELKKIQAAATDRPAVQQTFGIQARNLAKLSAAGMKVALGTDGNVSWAHHIEMEDMVRAGMTPNQVITAATGNAADLLRLYDVGRFESTKSADFIVLDANPLDDITNTRRISSVYLRGVEVDRAATRARMTGRAAQ